MANRLVHYLQGCIHSIFKDLEWMYTSKVDWERDLDRVLVQLRSRGPKFVTLDLPALENHLHACLDRGAFTTAPTLSKYRSRRTSIPVFLESLYKRVFSSSSGTLLISPCPNAILGLKTLFSFAKKIQVTCEEEKINESYQKFIDTDASLPDHIYDWNSDTFADDLQRSSRPHIREYKWDETFWSKFNNDDKNLIQRSFDIVSALLGLSPSYDGGLQEQFKPGHGPGASSEIRDGGSKYNLENWSLRQEMRFPYDYYACSALGTGTITSRRDTTSEVRGSRLIAVHKNMKGPRLIAAEPYSHMYIQKFIEQCLVHRFETTLIGKSISIKDQTNNQKLAHLSSVDRSYATIDLSEASDRVSLAIIESFLSINPEWLADIQSCRSPFVTLPDGRVVVYRKMSPQGSAVTFPLQSVLYYAICFASICIKNRVQPTHKYLRTVSRDIRIYGDDIIIKSEYLGVLRDLLSSFYMKVNTEKSFGNGYFRESCGEDAYKGYTVTPPRLKAVPSGNLAQLPSIVETSNNFYRAGFWHTSKYVQSFLSRFEKFIPVQKKSSFPVSLLSFVGDYYCHLDKRYNRNLQREELRVFTPRVSSKEERITGHGRLLQYYVEAPDPSTNWKSGTSHGHSVNYRVGWSTP